MLTARPLLPPPPQQQQLPWWVAPACAELVHLPLCSVPPADSALAHVRCNPLLCLITKATPNLHSLLLGTSIHPTSPPPNINLPNRQPAISFIYERGWRQNFAQAGFPGPEKEFDQAMDYFRPVLGGTLVDASCGTGLFTRKFARSGQWKGVVALDFSESMLQQAQTYFKEDAGLTSRWGAVAVPSAGPLAIQGMAV